MRTAREIATHIVTHEFSAADLELEILRHAEECVKLERQRCIAAVEELERLTREGNNDFQYSRVMAMLTRVRYAIAKDNS